jgi:hypothetical protein
LDLATVYDEREKLIEIVLGILHNWVVRMAGQSQWPAHDVVQAPGLRVREEASLSKNDGETQNSIESCDIESLLSFEHLLRRQIVFPLGHIHYLRRIARTTGIERAAIS